MLTLILGSVIIFLLIMIAVLEARSNRTLMSKLNAVSAPLSYIEELERSRQSAFEAKKNWKSYRETNLPRQKNTSIHLSSLSKEEMQRKADELESKIC